MEGYENSPKRGEENSIKIETKKWREVQYSIKTFGSCLLFAHFQDDLYETVGSANFSNAKCLGH